MALFFNSSSGLLPSFTQHKLIVPCISVGNVGQLTVDLLVNTWHLDRVGYLDHPAVLPLVGNDAFDHTHPAGYLHTAAEVYHSAEKKLVLVQLRTPLIKRLQGEFCSELLGWSKEVGISEIVVLTSSYAHERRDSQLVGEPFRFLLSSSADDLCSRLTEELKWTFLEPRGSQEESCSSLTAISSAEAQGHLHESLVFLPGAGLAKRIYKESDNLEIRLLMLIRFCSQGDNISDAVAMANKLDSWISTEKSTGNLQWSCPSSWEMMYGGPSPTALF